MLSETFILILQIQDINILYANLIIFTLCLHRDYCFDYFLFAMLIIEKNNLTTMQLKLILCALIGIDRCIALLH